MRRHFGLAALLLPLILSLALAVPAPSGAEAAPAQQGLAAAGPGLAAVGPGVAAAGPSLTASFPPAGDLGGAGSLGGSGEDEATDGFYTLLGPDGRELLRLGLRVHPGDMFLSEDNVWYEATGVGGFEVQMRPIPRDRWPLLPAASVSAGPSPGPAVTAAALPEPAAATPAAPGRGPHIRLYHSHSDESYTPSDGRSNIPEHGGIYQVGAVFRDALAGKGYDVIQDTAAHDPHDDAAYIRSRRTALKLLQQGATVLFDVHRDTAPAEAYRRTVAGQTVTQVMIVVGRDNPGMQASLGFAKAVKDAADRIHPRLIRGIFMGEGGYNQDLTPRNLLFEVGSFGNTREEAEAGIRLLADALPTVLGAPQAEAAAVPPPAAHPAERRGQSRALAWVAGLTAVGGLAFLLIASGGIGPAGARLRLLGREFADLFPRRRNRL